MAASRTGQENRAYSAAHFVLELDQNEKVGFCRTVQGGGIRTEILTSKIGNTQALFRQLAKPQYEDVSIEVGMGMSQTFYTWIENFFSGKVVRKSGAIVSGDFHFKERSRREFFEALIAELSFPTLDATDTNAAYMTLKLSPERIRFVKGSGDPLDATVGTMAQKLWTPANFFFSIDGYDAACKRVTKIEGFKITQPIHEYKSGPQRDAMKVPGRLEYPNLTFHVPEADGQPFMDLFTKRVIDGVPPSDTRIDGTLVLRDHKSRDLATITLTGIDIADCIPDRKDATSDQLMMLKVQISVESMRFSYGQLE